MTRQDPNPGPTNSAPAPAAPPKKWRRIVFRLAVALVALLVILIVLAPTLLSTSVARQMFLDWANARLAGATLQIREWSIGWQDGLTIDGLSLLNDHGSHLLDVGQIHTDVTLCDLLLKKDDLGSVRMNTIDFDARLDKTGHLNVLDIFKTTPDFRAFKGMFQLANASGTLNDARFGDSWIFDSIEGIISLTGPDQPIKDSLITVARLSNQKFGKITFKGSINPDNCTWKQDIGFNDLDAAALSPLLSRGNDGVQLSGELGGSLDVFMDGSDLFSLRGSAHINNPHLSGDALSGDTLEYPVIRGLLDISRQPQSMRWASAIVTDTDDVTFVAIVPDGSQDQVRAAVSNLFNRMLHHESHMQEPVGQGGNITLSANVPKLIAQLHNTAQQKTAATRPSQSTN